MPQGQLVVKKKIVQGSAVILTARVRDVDTGDPITSASISAARLRAYDVTTPSAPVLVVPQGEDPLTYDGDDLTPGDIILNALDTGYLAEDETGFNVRIDLDGQDYFPEGNRVYRVEVRWTPVAGAVYYPPLWELTTLPVYSEGQ